MRIGILAAVVLSSTIGLVPFALAQMTPPEHEAPQPPPVLDAMHEARLMPPLPSERWRRSW